MYSLGGRANPASDASTLAIIGHSLRRVTVNPAPIEDRVRIEVVDAVVKVKGGGGDLK
jgi:hypothetical protein